MKRILILAILLVPALAAAQTYRPLETTNEARQRHNAERYDTCTSSAATKRRSVATRTGWAILRREAPSLPA